MGADPAYLRAAFDSIEERHGSVRSYMAEIGVDSARAEAILDTLLTGSASRRSKNPLTFR
jgi:hypothetical protein